MQEKKNIVFSTTHKHLKNELDVLDTSCDKASACEPVGYYVERIAYLEALVKKYKFDYLTGLMGKQDFTDKFDRVFEEYQFADVGFYMAIIDIDGLHNVNRKQGYHAGDKLIKSVSNQLKDLFAFHQIYRISGDEFIAISRTSTMTEAQFREKLETLDNATYHADCADGYTSPKHMFKAVDKLLSEKKASRCSVPRS